MAFGKVLGIITEVLPIEKGVKKNGGEWMRQTFVVKKIEDSEYEHLAALTCSGDAIKRIAPKVGMTGWFVYDVESNKSNEGRWFTSAVCKRFDPIAVHAAAQDGTLDTNTPQEALTHAELNNAPQGGVYAPQGGADATQADDDIPF